ncbi:MAG: AraC family transcriptional regulator [Acidobacteriota bacterium]
MGQVTSLFVRKVLGIVDGGARPVDRAAILRSVGLRTDDPGDPAQMVSAPDYYRFLEHLTTVDHDPTTLPLRAGAAMRCDNYGAFGLAWKTAPDLRRSYERAQRYGRVLTSVSTYTLEPIDGGARLHLHRAGERRLGLRLSNEATLASIVQISREASRSSFRPTAAFLRHPAPEGLASHEEFFGCPLHFDSEHDALDVSDAALRAPNRLGDESVSSFIDGHLDAAVSQLTDDASLARRVRDRITRSLSDGVPTISEVAHHFALSGRTLQRRLADDGETFQSLVDEARRQLAERLLQHTDYSLADIAFMTGFAEQSSFTRTFKRWAGQTPRSYRLEASRR